MTATTIKVSSELRDRIAAEARGRGESVGRFLEELLDDWEHQQRMAAVGRAFAGPIDVEYRAETLAWDEISAGLPDV